MVRSRDAYCATVGSPAKQINQLVAPQTQAPVENSGVVPNTALAAVAPFGVSDLLVAYNASGVGTSGAGQKIAILIDTFPLITDLKAFWDKNKLNVQEKQIKLINVRGVQLPNVENTDGEETLDAEWASGIAPGATIAVYAAGSLQYVYLDRALARIFDDATGSDELRTVSISLGLREDLAQSVIDNENQLFGAMRALGVTVFVSSGDAGSNPASDGHSRSGDTIVEYEASDFNVIAVGGTTLKMDKDQTNERTKVISEVAWPDSGGGVSTNKLLLRQSWQPAYPQIDSDKRLVPDVSAVAEF